MYLGQTIYLVALTLPLKSWIAALITLGTAIWFHTRVVGDEKKLIGRLGKPYMDYRIKVKR